MASKWAQLEPVMTVIWAKPLLQQGHPNKHNHNARSKSGWKGLCFFYTGAQHANILLHFSNVGDPILQVLLSSTYQWCSHLLSSPCYPGSDLRISTTTESHRHLPKSAWNLGTSTWRIFGRGGWGRSKRPWEPRICICISRESNPGHIDGNDVFYH